MDCPRCGRSDIEQGNNQYMEVEFDGETVRKMVCDNCAEKEYHALK